MRSNGSRVWTRLLVKCITPGGTAGETVWLIDDISARKEMEAALAKARDDLEQRVRAAHDELAWSNERLVAELYERSEVEERARRIALYDELTELPIGDCSNRGSTKRFAIINSVAIGWRCWWSTSTSSPS